MGFNVICPMACTMCIQTRMSENQLSPLDRSQEVSLRRFRAKQTRALQAMVFDAEYSTVFQPMLFLAKQNTTYRLTLEAGRNPLGQPDMGSSESPLMKQIRLKIT
jgi:hypothetical protein